MAAVPEPQGGVAHSGRSHSVAPIPSELRMASSAALPLKVTSTHTPSKAERTNLPVTSSSAAPKQTSGISDPSDISSPHELTAYVRHILSSPTSFRKLLYHVPAH